MSATSKIFKAMAGKAPRLRGFSSNFYFGHPFLDAWFAWFPLNQIEYGGAATGEIFKVAARIDEADLGSWISEWVIEGDRLRDYAEGLKAREHRNSAARTFLRAYTCYRTAHLATDPGIYGKEMTDTYTQLRYCFDQFVTLSGMPIVEADIPLRSKPGESQKSMRGYFMHSRMKIGSPAPTLVWLNGAESLVEDMYWWCAAEGMDRGFNVFAVDAPGDTATRIDRPDLLEEGSCDLPLLSQIDYLLQHPAVDPEKLFVYGISMGGYKAGRLAQIDDRVTGIAANAPMLDASKVLSACKDTYKNKNGHGWANRMCWQYGVDFTGDLKTSLEELVDGVWGRFTADPSKVKVPFLTMAGENELGDEGINQAHRFHEGIAHEKKVKRITTADEGAGAHCQLDNFPLARTIVFDWIEDLMKKRA